MHRCADGSVDRGRVALLLAFLLVIWKPVFLGSEVIQMTTYYPAPYGGYVSLLTTGANNAHTFLARDGANVMIGGAGALPTTKMDLRGGDISVDPNRGVIGRGNVYMDGPNGFYVMNSAGGVVSRARGGTGNLLVEGDLTVTGRILNVCKTLSFNISTGWTGCGANYRLVTAIPSSQGRFVPLYDNLANFTGIAAEYHILGGTIVCCRIF